jgi:hypothetical protein
MNLVEVNPGVTVDLDSITKVEFEPAPDTIVGERAKLLSVEGTELVLAGGAAATSIPALQQIRETVGSGTGTTGWVRARKEGVIGDDEDSYINLTKVEEAVLGSATDGAIAGLKALNGVELGQVHLSDALEVVKNKFSLG